MPLNINPNLALIPSGYKASKVYSVLPNDGSGDFTFTRSGNATRVNSDGLIELVSSNVPRLNYPLIDGVVQGCPSLLLEPQSSNLYPYSSEINNSRWTLLSGGTGLAPVMNSSSEVAKDGTNTACEWVFNTGSGTTSSDQSNIFYSSISTIIGTSYTFSVWVYSLSNNIEIQLRGAGTTFEKFIINSGWNRISRTAAATGTSTNPVIGLRQGVNGTVNSNITVYLWGAQFEVGSYATSYIPTQGATATRVAETCKNAGDVNTFNDSEGVLFAEISALSDLDTTRYITLNQGTNTVNALQIQYRNNGELRLYNGGTSTPQMIYRDTTIDLSEKIKIAIKYGTTSSDYKVYINGFSKTIEGAFVATSMSGLDTLKFTDINAVGSLFYGNTKQIQYFNTALNDTDLEKLTSWDSFSDMAIGQLYTIE